ncbi:MAG TPA: hypothetical protein PK844_00820 [Candidatus Atribacteria bacterium]|nr:hypothetical protein [Candidatus Atribacteria bacterium]HQE25042.1 hypothetical protein [Candidatus Atribacteria bacterium]
MERNVKDLDLITGSSELAICIYIWHVQVRCGLQGIKRRPGRLG